MAIVEKELTQGEAPEDLARLSDPDAPRGAAALNGASLRHHSRHEPLRRWARHCGQSRSDSAPEEPFPQVAKKPVVRSKAMSVLCRGQAVQGCSAY